MAKLLERVFTIVFSPDYERTGFEFLLTSINHVYCSKDDNNRYCYKVRQSDLVLLDDAGIPYQIAD